MTSDSEKLGEIRRNLDLMTANHGTAHRYMRDLSESIASACSGSDIHSRMSIEFQEDVNQVTYYGYIQADKDGLSLSLRSSQDDEEDALQPDQNQYISYSRQPVERWTEYQIATIMEKDLISQLISGLRDLTASQAQLSSHHVARLAELLNTPLLALDKQLSSDSVFSQTGSTLDEWSRAMSQVDSDPANAAKLAGVALETFLKHFLNAKKAPDYNSRDTLRQLIEKSFKLIDLQNSVTKPEVVALVKSLKDSLIAIGAVRNNLSTAHGKGPGQTSVSREEARLQVTISGAICLYIARECF